VAFEFAQVVAKLVKTVGFFRNVEALENDLMNLLGGPAAEVIDGRPRIPLPATRKGTRHSTIRSAESGASAPRQNYRCNHC
jgi:hypothetical protein